MLHIAVLEDDPDQSDLLCLWLQEAGYQCRAFNTAAGFQRSFLRDTYDLLLFDWELPESSGIRVLRWVRDNCDWQIPVLFVTRREKEEDIVYALEQGADDYMAKPVTKAITLARVRALARRSGVVKEEAKVMEFGALQINFTDGAILRDGRPVELTEREGRLAFTLFSNLGRLLSRDYLLETVWGVSGGVATRTVDTHVSRLRQKLGLTPDQGWQLKAIYQHGYRLEQLSGDSAVAS